MIQINCVWIYTKYYTTAYSKQKVLFNNFLKTYYHKTVYKLFINKNKAKKT